MARGALLDIALSFERVVVGTSPGKPHQIPPFRVKPSRSAKLATFVVVGHSHTAMTPLAERLNSMTAAAVGCVAPRFHCMHAYVVANVNVHGLFYARVASRAEVLFVAACTKIGVVLSHVFMVGAKLHIVSSAPEIATGREHSEPRKRRLHAITGLSKMACGAAIAGLLSIVTPLAALHGGQMRGRRQLNLREAAVTASARRSPVQMSLVAEFEIGNWQSYSRYGLALATRG